LTTTAINYQHTIDSPTGCMTLKTYIVQWCKPGLYLKGKPH